MGKDYQSIKAYSDVVNGGFILPRKEKYTIRDVDRVITESLFDGVSTADIQKAAFIVRCSAIYWDTDYSKSVVKAGKTILV